MSSINVNLYLYEVLKESNKKGFITANKSKQLHVNPTWLSAYNNLIDNRNKNKSNIINEDLINQVIFIKKYINNYIIHNESSNHFYKKLHKLISNNETNKKDLPTLAYTIHLYNKLIDKNPNINNEHIGQIKRDIIVSGYIDFIRPMRSQFNNGTLIKLIDNNKHLISWFSSNSNLALMYELGDHITLKGYVKEHKIWNNQHETCLTRCKIL